MTTRVDSNEMLLNSAGADVDEVDSCRPDDDASGVCGGVLLDPVFLAVKAE